MPVRTFFAVDLDDAVLDRMAAVRDKLDDAASKINWVARENLHVTLNFLGDVPDDLLPQVLEIAAGAAGLVEPFDLEIAGVTATPPRGAPRMIWADVEDPTGRLATLHEQLDAGLSGLGLRQEERNYRPHITLARIKYAANPARLRSAAAELADRDFGCQPVDELTAYSSELTREGPIYTVMARSKLGQQLRC